MADETTEQPPTPESPRVTIEDDPIEVRLRYAGSGTSLHQKIISRLIARRKLSERAMSLRYDSWNRVDEHCRLYIDLSRGAKKGDTTIDTDKKEIPWARSIVVPMSYAILQVYLTQLMGIYTRRDPPLEIHGVGPEDIRPAKLMNAVIAYDQVQTNYVLELYTALQDAMKYGVGGFHDWWQVEYGYTTQRFNPLMAKMRSMIGLPETTRNWEKRKEHQGVEAFDPFLFFPDPRISLSKMQKGEFNFLRVYRGYLEILAGSQENGGNYFNVEAIPKTAPKPQSVRSRNRFQVSQMNLIGSMDERDKGFHAIDTGMVSLIPEEWEVGPGTRPEKWQFAWVDDTVIIRAHRADFEHDDFNVSALESNIDTHVFGNQGSIENLDGLQRFMTWFMNSHIQNVIRFLNNRMIYSAALVEAFDVDNPDAAMNIKLTPLGEQMLREGRMTIPQMIHQITLVDATKGMLQDINFFMDLAMRMSGAAESMQARTTMDKRTLGEVQQVIAGASARMNMHAMMMDVQGIRPLALRWVSNRQQYTDTEMYVRVAGKLAEEFGGERIKVKPKDIHGNFDYLPRTGPEPMNPEQMADIMERGLSAILGNKEILAIPDKNGKMLDIHEIIKETYRDRGVKNPEDFYRNMLRRPGQQPPAPDVRVAPDEEVERMRQAGNAVPVEEQGRRPMAGGG